MLYRRGVYALLAKHQCAGTGLWYGVADGARSELWQAQGGVREPQAEPGVLFQISQALPSSGCGSSAWDVAGKLVAISFPFPDPGVG